MNDYNTKIFIGMFEDGRFDQEIYGDGDKICDIMEYLLKEIYKVLYLGISGDLTRKSARTNEIIESIVKNAVLRAVEEIQEGDFEGVEYDEL